MSYKTQLNKFIVALSVFSLLMPSALPVQAAERTISFAGRTWTVRSDGGGPGPNQWATDSNAVFVDAQGRLHLKVLSENGQWYSSEVFLPTSLGYGSYSFDIASRVDLTDTNLVASPFLYQDDSHEIDIEFSDWQSPGAPRGNFTVQPWQKESTNNRKFPFSLQDGLSTHTITWLPDAITLESRQGNNLLSSWTYRGSDNFAPGNEQLHLNHWMIDGLPPSNGQEEDFVIAGFTFTPASLLTAPPIITATPTPSTPSPAPINPIVSPSVTATNPINQTVTPTDNVPLINPTNVVTRKNRVRHLKTIRRAWRYNTRSSRY